MNLRDNLADSVNFDGARVLRSQGLTLIGPIYSALWGLGILWFGEYLSRQLDPIGNGSALASPLVFATAAITGAVIGLAASLSHREFRS
jgi:hypothetical protein